MAVVAALGVEASGQAPDSPACAEICQALYAGFSAGWPESTYAIATVDTPAGLWNVYIVSIPPDQVGIRQSRQDGEYEFGMTGEVIWHSALGKGTASRLGPDWRWFIRGHEIFRFSEWLERLEFQASRGIRESAETACEELVFSDEFGLETILCVDPGTARPVRIERHSPASYGDAPVVYDALEWRQHQGRTMLAAYRQTGAGDRFGWEIQSVIELSDEQASTGLKPPESLR